MSLSKTWPDIELTNSKALSENEDALLQVVMHVEVNAIATQKDILHGSVKAEVSSHIVHCILESW